MRRFLVLAWLLLFAAPSGADTRRGFEACQKGDFKIHFAPSGSGLRNPSTLFV